MADQIEGDFLWSRGHSIVQVAVRGPGSRQEEIVVVVDTAFSGAIALPKVLIERLRLQFRGLSAELEMADGRRRRFPMYDATVRWGDTWRQVRAVAAEGGPAIGIHLLRNHSLWIELVPGGKVRITPMSGGAL